MPVGLKEPNLLRLHDMSGNVGDWVDEYYPELGKEAVYNNPDEREMRLARGVGVSSEVQITKPYWRAGALLDQQPLRSDFGER